MLGELLNPLTVVLVVRLAQALPLRLPVLRRPRPPIGVAVPVRGRCSKRGRTRPHDEVHPLPGGDHVCAVPLPPQVQHPAPWLVFQRKRRPAPVVPVPEPATEPQAGAVKRGVPQAHVHRHLTRVVVHVQGGVFAGSVVDDEGVVVVQGVVEQFVRVKHGRERRQEAIEHVGHQTPHPDLVHDQPAVVHRVRPPGGQARLFVRLHFVRDQLAKRELEDVEGEHPRVGRPDLLNGRKRRRRGQD
mmetsp:Transcript_28703/g.58678  ORF Transcript_28703/g.58678 Transcript_28703/m.58678 type:complete len:243 (-) Transcript_28703:428-1156(-)